ncbi:hypothetical protein PCY06_07250 [Streptococcus sp. SG1]|jgi:hypothetical protein|uniref:hypothetical protein n=1 Tax=Streptococcus TaxID=1301 RepID=UPI0007792C8F|nr:MULTISPECIES: hypothetical protein [Streptococcus]MBZ2117089.1 hypothetical protein [Streptococcus gordonii]MCB6407057.1 hypothetical protein [Streptococcus gordonii]MCY7137412.1 hypothetical protein [Streptococcus gordonii]MCY7138080.1 hypothetical protein [Streptococcus gordonii]MDN5019196.1 hypothetical protein [Streptococcus sp. SG1]
MTSKEDRVASIKAKLDALDGEIEALKAAQKALNDTNTKVSYKPDKTNVDNLKGKKYKEETADEKDYLEGLEKDFSAKKSEVDAKLTTKISTLEWDKTCVSFEYTLAKINPF